MSLSDPFLFSPKPEGEHLQLLVQTTFYLFLFQLQLSSFKFPKTHGDLELYERWRKKSKIEDTRQSVELMVSSLIKHIYVFCPCVK